MLNHQLNELPQRTRLIYPMQMIVRKNLAKVKLRHQITWQYPVLTVNKNI